MRYRIAKFMNAVAYSGLLVLTVFVFTSGFGLDFDAVAVIVSGLWLGLTELDHRSMIRTFLFINSRIRLLGPIVLGFAFGIAAIATAVIATVPSLPLIAVAAAELLLWGRLYLVYRRNRKHYTKDGTGILPDDVWLNPPAAALIPSDQFLTCGKSKKPGLENGGVAHVAHEGVGHGATLLSAPDDSLCTLTSLMATGAIINPIEEMTEQHAHGDYVVLRLREPFDAQKNAIAYAIAQIMVAENAAYRDRTNATIDRFFDRLPLPASLKTKLRSKVKVTGYDFFGLVWGRLMPDHWTCIGACLELYRRMGVHTDDYGTGLFGLGTGFLNTVMPVSLLVGLNGKADPAFTPLTLRDKEAYERRTAASQAS